MITPHLSSPPSATWTASSTSVYIETTSSTSTFVETTSSTSTFIETTSSTSNTLCTSAEWDRYGITIVSNVDYPYGIAIDSEDNLIIASDEKLSLQKYLTNGTMIKLVTDSRIPSVFIDKFDNIYFTVALANRVDKLNSYDGSIITAAGGNGLGHGLDQLYLTGDPGIYVDQNSTLYISDTGNSRVMKYYENATSGIVVAGGHGQGSSSNQLNTPYGIYVDEIIEIGAIYICDQFNRRIQKWLPGAKEGITVAINNDQLRSPNAILLAPISNEMMTMMMFISVFDYEKVLKWIPYAKQAESVVAGSDHGVELEPDTLFGQRGMTFDKNWNLYVADTGHNRIQKFLFNVSSSII
ncbi:hypothetical protein I4U23_016275 [Adineta vaga]|nr:hypothetical protein I4U23_016275 [Adineta vaga]